MVQIYCFGHFAINQFLYIFELIKYLITYGYTSEGSKIVHQNVIILGNLIHYTSSIVQHHSALFKRNLKIHFNCIYPIN